MAQAIITGAANAGLLNQEDVYIFDITADKRALMSSLGLKVCESSKELVTLCDIIFLAVKPQNYADVLSEIKPVLLDGKLIVTIAAGISMGYINSHLYARCPVIRVMPNTPVMVGKGATAMARSEDVKEDDFDFVYGLFKSSGEVVVLPESKMNSVIAVNASSPAYVYLFAKAMIDYATEQGIDAESARMLVSAAIEGSAVMLRSTGESPYELITKVSSKGGTTVAALETLEKNNFYGAIKEAMGSCTERAEQLGR